MEFMDADTGTEELSQDEDVLSVTEVTRGIERALQSEPCVDGDCNCGDVVGGSETD